jgi:hypothetical protein
MYCVFLKYYMSYNEIPIFQDFLIFGMGYETLIISVDSGRRVVIGEPMEH